MAWEPLSPSNHWLPINSWEGDALCASPTRDRKLMGPVLCKSPEDNHNGLEFKRTTDMTGPENTPQHPTPPSPPVPTLFSFPSAMFPETYAQCVSFSPGVQKSLILSTWASYKSLQSSLPTVNSFSDRS